MQSYYTSSAYYPYTILKTKIFSEILLCKYMGSSEISNNVGDGSILENTNGRMPRPRDIDIIAFLEKKNIDIDVKRIMARIIAVMQEDNRWSSFQIDNVDDKLFSVNDAYEEDLIRKLVKMNLLEVDTIGLKRTHTVTSYFIGTLPLLKSQKLIEANTSMIEIDPNRLVIDTLLPRDLALYRLLYECSRSEYERCLATLLVASSQKNDIWEGIPIDNLLVSSDLESLSYFVEQNYYATNNSMVSMGDKFLEEKVEAIRDRDKRIAVYNNWTVGDYKMIINYFDQVPQVIMNIVKARENNGQKGTCYSYTTKTAEGKEYQVITFCIKNHRYSISQEEGETAIFSLEDGLIKDEKRVPFAPVNILTEGVARDWYIVPWIKEFTKEINESNDENSYEKLILPKGLKIK